MSTERFGLDGGSGATGVRPETWREVFGSRLPAGSHPGRKTRCPHRNGGSASDARAAPGSLRVHFSAKRKGPRARARGRVRPRRRRDDASGRRRAERQPAGSRWPRPAARLRGDGAQPARTASSSSPLDNRPLPAAPAPCWKTLSSCILISINRRATSWSSASIRNRPPRCADRTSSTARLVFEMAAEVDRIVHQQPSRKPKPTPSRNITTVTERVPSTTESFRLIIGQAGSRRRADEREVLDIIASRPRAGSDRSPRRRG